MDAPFDQAAAEALGYSFETLDPTHVAYSKGGELRGSAEGSTPLFSALATIAEDEGQGFAQGYGGLEPITVELVLAVSGETYVPPADESYTTADELAAQSEEPQE